jgi:hypothetical protein
LEKPRIAPGLPSPRQQRRLEAGPSRCIRPTRDLREAGAREVAQGRARADGFSLSPKKRK